MNWWLILAGFLVHLTFFYSIFDIYFTSPLVHGMTPHSSTLAPPADRLVLFVADGLRADKLYEFDENGTNRAPYLRHIMESVGAWGVSHTRVPTESRPGHVALIAGFYEDVSAVAKGWKENPVEFDSLFNESAWTWSWGSPDILPMFAHSAHRNHVYTKMYPAESEDFAGAELFKLDTWVFDSVKDFFSNAKEDEILLKKLLETKVVFFLHLLGLDTNGHAHRPYSAEYLENIRLVDNGIKEIVELFDSFYGDNKTAFVLTADHGMTNWGSHGAGHPSETLTPLIAWGAGIRSPVTGSSTQQHFDDDFLTSWKLEHIKRSDVNQADVCPLMASVIGVPYPLNSVGVLPVDYLEDNLESKAVNLFTNAKQVLEQYRVKMEQKKKTTLSAFFIPFQALKNSHQAKYVQHIHSSISSGSYEKAIKESQKLLDLALEGLTYYHNYDRFFLGASITMGFLGWMGYLLTLIIQHDTSLSPPRNQLDWKPQGFLLGEKGIRLIFCGIGIIVFCLLYIQHLQWTYYIYCLTPVVLWQKIFQRRKVLQALYWYIVDHGILLKTIILSALGLVGLEIIVSSFFTRELLSIGLVAIAVWPFFNLASKEKIPPLLGCAWCAAALGMAVFPLLPVVGRAANYPLVYVAGILTICLGLLGARNISQQSKIKGNKQLLWVQFLLILIATGIVFKTSSSISEKEGLPLLNQICSWIILGLSLVLPLCSTTVLKPRLLHLGLGLLPPYLLLSTSHEALFALLLLTFMFLWIQVEATLASRHKGLSELDFSQDAGLLDTPRKLQLADLRIGYFFIYFLIVGFFGTGNIASINSFDPASVMCFLTVFSPFVMGALMLIKVLIPFLLVCSAFHGVHLTIRVPTQSLVLVVLLMSDFMALHFFFLVQDYGSWLEIGTSISHYVIVMAMICFLLILLAVSKVLTHVTLLPKKKHHSL